MTELPCTHKKPKRMILCSSCSQDPFLVEKIRDYYASHGDITSFKNTYKKKFPQIKNINTGSFWDKRWKNTDSLRFQDGMTKDRIRIATSYIHDTNIKILDIGAGFGFLEERLVEKKKLSLHANDFSSESIRILRKKFKGTFKIESVYDLKYEDNFFDVVCILEVLEHIPVSRVFEVIKRINRIIKKGGLLIVSVPLNEELDKMLKNPNGHVRTYTPEIIKTELNLFGFEIIESKFLYAFRDMYTLKKIIANLFKNKWRPNNIIIKAIKV